MSAAAFSGIGAAVGFLVNFLVLMHGGAVPKGGVIAGGGNLAAGTLFWGLVNMLIFAVIASWYSMGTRKFFGAVASFPGSIAGLFGSGGRMGRVHLLWGMGTTMCVSVLISPAIGAATAAILIVSLPSLLGGFVASLLFRCCSGIVSWFRPARRDPVDGAVMMAVGLMGAALALFVGCFVASMMVKIILGAGCVVLAFVLSGRVRATQTAIIAALWCCLGAEPWQAGSVRAADEAGSRPSREVFYIIKVVGMGNMGNGIYAIRSKAAMERGMPWSSFSHGGTSNENAKFETVSGPFSSRRATYEFAQMIQKGTLRKPRLAGGLVAEIDGKVVSIDSSGGGWEEINAYQNGREAPPQWDPEPAKTPKKSPSGGKNIPKTGGGEVAAQSGSATGSRPPTSWQQKALLAALAGLVSALGGLLGGAIGGGVASLQQGRSPWWRKIGPERTAKSGEGGGKSDPNDKDAKERARTEEGEKTGDKKAEEINREWQEARQKGQQLVDEFKKTLEQLKNATDPAERAQLEQKLRQQAAEMNTSYAAKNILKADAGAADVGRVFDETVRKIYGEVDKLLVERLNAMGMTRGGKPFTVDDMVDLRNKKNLGTVGMDRDYALSEMEYRKLVAQLNKAVPGSPEALELARQLGAERLKTRMTVDPTVYRDMLSKQGIDARQQVEDLLTQRAQMDPQSEEARKIDQEVGRLQELRDDLSRKMQDLDSSVKRAGDLREAKIADLQRRLAEADLRAPRSGEVQAIRDRIDTLGKQQELMNLHRRLQETPGSAEAQAIKDRIAELGIPPEIQISRSDWNEIAQAVYNEAYAEKTGTSAEKAFQLVTTGKNKEAYQDLPVLQNDPLRHPFSPGLAEQTASVSRVKQMENQHMADHGLIVRGEAIQETARGYAKDLNTKLLPLLQSDPRIPPEKLDMIQRISATLNDVGSGKIAPGDADAKLREAVPEVKGMSMDMATRILDANMEAAIKWRTPGITPPPDTETKPPPGPETKTPPDNSVRQDDPRRAADDGRSVETGRPGASARTGEAGSSVQSDKPLSGDKWVHQDKPFDGKRPADPGQPAEPTKPNVATSESRLQSIFGKATDLATVNQHYEENVKMGMNQSEALAVAISQTAGGSMVTAAGVTDPRMSMVGGTLLPQGLNNLLPDQMAENTVGTGYQAGRATLQSIRDSYGAGQLDTKALDDFAQRIVDRPGADPFKGIGLAAQTTAELLDRTDGGSLMQDLRQIHRTGAGTDVLVESATAFRDEVAHGDHGVVLQGVEHVIGGVSEAVFDPSGTAGGFVQDVRNIYQNGVGDGFWKESWDHTASVIEKTPVVGTVVQGYNELAAGLGEHGVVGFTGEVLAGGAALGGEMIDSAGDAARSAHDYLRSFF